METENYTLKVLIPSEGYKLTTVEDIDDEHRLIAEKIFLGINDSEDNYKEITNEEANRILKMQNEL